MVTLFPLDCFYHSLNTIVILTYYLKEKNKWEDGNFLQVWPRRISAATPLSSPGMLFLTVPPLGRNTPAYELNVQGRPFQLNKRNHFMLNI